MVMDSGITETLLGAQADMKRIHRRIVRVGAVAAWFAAAVFLTAGFFTGNDELFVEAVGPILAAGLMTSQVVLHREHGGVALLGSAVIVMGAYGIVGNEATLMPASLALVVICAIGMLLVTRHQFQVMGGVAVMLALTPHFWGVAFGEALQLGSVMALAFLMTAIVFNTIRNAATALNAKFKVMFEQSPTALFEEDWADAVTYLRSEYDGRPDRIRQFLLAYPDVVRRAVGRARITRVNQAAIDLLEASGPEQLLGSRDPDKVTDDNVESFVEALAALFEGKERFEREFLGYTFKGRRVWLHARCVDNTAGTSSRSVLVALADISHARAKEEALADLIRAKDTFIASISHELRTPLTAVVGLTSEMSSSAMGDAEKAELMELVSDQAEEMSYIVEDLLVAARAEIGAISLDLDTVDLEEQLALAVDGVGVDLDTPDTLPMVRADASRVRQILRNLLTNLNRYGGPNRRIVGGALGERAWVEVRDDGAGVDPEDVDRIFEPYATAHVGVSGSVGLGLSVARQLAEAMGGSLTYRRDSGESVFRLELPMIKTPIAV